MASNTFTKTSVRSGGFADSRSGGFNDHRSTSDSSSSHAFNWSPLIKLGTIVAGVGVGIVTVKWVAKKLQPPPNPDYAPPSFFRQAGRDVGESISDSLTGVLEAFGVAKSDPDTGDALWFFQKTRRQREEAAAANFDEWLPPWRSNERPFR